MAHIVAIASPIVAELENPIPFGVFIMFTVIANITALVLKKH